MNKMKKTVLISMIILNCQILNNLDNFDIDEKAIDCS